MKIIKPSVSILDPNDEWINQSAVKRAEFCGRVCYNSLSRITEDSASGFVLDKVNLGHGSVLEHGAVYLAGPARVLPRVCDNKYTVAYHRGKKKIICTNLRVLSEEEPELFEAIVHGDEITKWNVSYFKPADANCHRLVTVDFVVDRGVTHEIVRNRGNWPGNSFSQESTRYCNYAGEKEGEEITVIEPFFWERDSVQYEVWRVAVAKSEEAYMGLIARGATPQQARSVLPNSLKARLLMTSSLLGWREFLKLRTPPDAHPQMREIAIPLLRLFEQVAPSLFGDIKS